MNIIRIPNFTANYRTSKINFNAKTADKFTHFHSRNLSRNTLFQSIIQISRA